MSITSRIKQFFGKQPRAKGLGEQCTNYFSREYHRPVRFIQDEDNRLQVAIENKSFVTLSPYFSSWTAAFNWAADNLKQEQEAQCQSGRGICALAKKL